MLTPSHLLGQKVKPRWPPIEGNFVRQFQSFTRLQSSVFVWFGFESIHNHGKKCSDDILLDQFYINGYFKVFIIAVWPKKCAKLSKGGKLT